MGGGGERERQVYPKAAHTNVIIQQKSDVIYVIVKSLLTVLMTDWYG